MLELESSSNQKNLNSFVEISMEVENIILQVQSSKEVFKSVTSLNLEVFQILSKTYNEFVVSILVLKIYIYNAGY